jgi:predicted amidohydrolase
MTLRIGVAQARLFDSIEANTANILAFIDEADRQGVRILGFPETALTGYLFDGFACLDWEKQEAAVEKVADRLRGGRLAIVLGTPTRENGAVHNSALVMLPDGARYVYHKINLVPCEQAWFAPGGTPLRFEVEQAGFGVQICKDQGSPELSRALAKTGVRGIFLCSAHYYEPVEARMKLEKNVALPIARAYENGMFVFKANAVGATRGQVSYGTSMIIDSRGIVVHRAGETREELLFHDIDLSVESPHWNQACFTRS